MAETKEIPNGEKRESHHVPAKSLVDAWAKELDKVAAGYAGPELDQFEYLWEDYTKSLATRASQFRKAHKSVSGGKESLSAILIHSKTHAGEEFSVHSANSKDTSARILKDLGSDAIVIRTKANDVVASNPQEEHWEAFIAACFERVKAKDLEEGMVVRCNWATWQTGNDCDGGIRILPGRPLEEWVLAEGDRGAVSTRGSRLGRSVPLWAWCAQPAIMGHARSVDNYRKRWDVRREGLAAVHELFGGDPALLDVLDGLVHDETLLPFTKLPRAQRRARFYDVARALDPSPEHVAFRGFLERQFESDGPLLPPDGLGVWEGAALTACVVQRDYEVSHHSGDGSEDHEIAAWRLLHHPPQIDRTIGADAGLRDHLLSSTGTTNAGITAKLYVLVSRASPALLDEWSKQPIFQTVLAALARDDEGPWHLAYMEAAAEYDGLDQPEVAWNMLCSGAFWVEQRGGPWRPFFDAAVALASRRGWVDCEAALLDMAERAQLD